MVVKCHEGRVTGHTRGVTCNFRYDILIGTMAKHSAGREKHTYDTACIRCDTCVPDAAVPV